MLLPSGLHSSQDGSDIVVDRPSITTTLWNDGIHIVDTVRYMSGSEVVSIDNGVERVAGDSTNVYTARCGAPGSIGLDYQPLCLLRWPSSSAVVGLLFMPAIS